MEAKLTVPLLPLASQALDTWRSEDFQLPTSFRKQEDEPDERLADHFDRLNDIVQLAMKHFDRAPTAPADKAGISYQELLWMTLEDWAGHEARGESQLFSTIEDVSSFLSPMKLLDLDFNEDSRLHRARTKHEEGSRLHLYTAYLARLRHDLANLTGQPFVTVKDQPEVELPVFCRQILASFNDLKQVSFDSRLVRESTPAPVSRVKCTIDGLFDIRERLDDILTELAEACVGKDYKVQLGDFGLVLEVEVSDEAFVTPQKALGTEQEPAVHNESTEYISCLEAEVMELQARLIGADQPEAALYAKAQESRVMDLELQVESLSEALSLAQQQVWALSKASCSLEVSSVVEASAKSEVVRHLEELLLQELDSFKAEKAKLAEQAKHFEAETSMVLQEHQAENESVLQDLAEELEQQLAKETVLQQRIQQLQSEVDTLKSPDLSQVMHHRRDSGTYMEDLSQVVHHRRDSGTWMEVSESQSLDGLRLELAKCYSQLENHDPQRESASAIRQEIKEIRSKLDVLHTKQALQAVQHNIEHTDLSLKQLEDQWLASNCASRQAQSLGKDPLKPTSSCSSRPQSLRTTTDITVTSDRDQLTFRSMKQDQMSSERAELAKARAELESDTAKFSKKKALLKAKINKVNERQHKLVELERGLAEKQAAVLIQEKKQSCHKQAIDEEWARIDQKRHDVLKCHRMMDEEWQLLIEETKQFETLKLQDREAQADLTAEWRRLQRQLEEVESSRGEHAKFKAQLQENLDRIERQRENLDRERRKIAKEREHLSLEREKLQLHKQEMYEHMKEVTRKDTSFERHPRTLDRRPLDKGRRDRSMTTSMRKVDES
jgi:hypothetical protein